MDSVRLVVGAEWLDIVANKHVVRQPVLSISIDCERSGLVKGNLTTVKGNLTTVKGNLTTGEFDPSRLRNIGANGASLAKDAKKGSDGKKGSQWIITVCSEDPPVTLTLTPTISEALRLLWSHALSVQRSVDGVQYIMHLVRALKWVVRGKEARYDSQSMFLKVLTDTPLYAAVHVRPDPLQHHYAVFKLGLNRYLYKFGLHSQYSILSSQQLWEMAPYPRGMMIVYTRSRHCSHCGETAAPLKPLLRCLHCLAVHYCSQKCQRGHWEAFHRQECKSMQLPTLDEHQQMAAAHQSIRAEQKACEPHPSWGSRLLPRLAPILLACAGFVPDLVRLTCEYVANLPGCDGAVVPCWALHASLVQGSFILKLPSGKPYRRVGGVVDPLTNKGQLLWMTRLPGPTSEHDLIKSTKKEEEKVEVDEKKESGDESKEESTLHVTATSRFVVGHDALDELELDFVLVALWPQDAAHALYIDMVLVKKLDVEIEPQVHLHPSDDSQFTLSWYVYEEPDAEYARPSRIHARFLRKYHMGKDENQDYCLRDDVGLEMIPTNSYAEDILITQAGDRCYCVSDRNMLSVQTLPFAPADQKATSQRQEMQMEILQSRNYERLFENYVYTRPRSMVCTWHGTICMLIASGLQIYDVDSALRSHLIPRQPLCTTENLTKAFSHFPADVILSDGMQLAVMGPYLLLSVQFRVLAVFVT